MPREVRAKENEKTSFFSDFSSFFIFIPFSGSFFSAGKPEEQLNLSF